MGTLILVRHGRSHANREHILAGRTPGVLLDAVGRRQADGLPARLRGHDIAAIVASPLERCRETVAPLAAARGLPVVTDERLIEVDYGRWTGRALKGLRDEPAWRVVQQQPSAMVFPDGEAMAEVSARAVEAARSLGEGRISASTVDRPVASGGGAASPPGQRVSRPAPQRAPAGSVVVCAHGDVIAMILADALGMHLDSFQRLMVAPASISIVHYTDVRPLVAGINVPGRLPPPALSHHGKPDAELGGVTGDGAAATAKTSRIS